MSDEVIGEIERGIGAFEPDLILVSCGFDAAEGDEEGFTLTPNGYAEFIRRIINGRPSARCIVVMEGGYKPPIIEACVEAIGSVMITSLPQV